MAELVEANYPIDFRRIDSQVLGKHLKHHNSVVLMGMKRVGISNFLRFFLNHQSVPKTYIKNGEQLFVVVDMNDMVERTLTAFWTLTLKRIVDAVDQSRLSEETKEEIRHLLVKSIQVKDLFFTYDSVRRSLETIVEMGVFPVLFLIRFDRLRKEITSEFFANLQGLKDATGQKLSYVFTSFRPLDELCPKVFSRSAMSVFAANMYLKPAKETDAKIVLETFCRRYDLTFAPKTEKALLDLAGGHVQYLQLMLIKIQARGNAGQNGGLNELEVGQDEEVELQSEELLASLAKNEQRVMLKVARGEKLTEGEKEKARYLWDTGLVKTSAKTDEVFTPLLKQYLTKFGHKQTKGEELTKKEAGLFDLLKNRLGEVCDRDEIVEVVWPEQEELGVTDWAIDRLVSRLREKLVARKSHYRILTVFTRGYKLVED